MNGAAARVLPLAVVEHPAADPVAVRGFPSPAAELPTIGACLGTFLRRIVPTHAAYAAARDAIADVVAVLRGELYAKGSFDESAGTDHLLAGSVGKRTAIAPVQMVDLLYLLPAKLKGNKVDDALKIVWAVLKSRFDGAAIEPAGTGVLVQRGAHWIKVLPCLRHAGGFLMPGRPTLTRARGWSVTNPLAEAATLRLSDSLYAGRPRLLLAALKAWRENADVPLSSFALELLAQEFYACAPRPYELERALVDFWAWSRKRASPSLKPPGGQSTFDIGDKWHAKAKTAYWRAMLTDHHLKEGKILDAALEWRHILGPAFPIPGERPSKTLPLFRKTG